VAVAVNRAGKSGYLLAGSVALVTFLVYLPALRNEFVYWDDNLYVFENPHIRSLDTAFFRWAFLGFRVSNWHPLTWVSHAVDYAIWGMNPAGHHLTNDVLHAVNTGLVVLLALKLLAVAREGPSCGISVPGPAGRRNLVAAGGTGLLFGLHPLHVESVAWVAERKDLLCAFFFLLSLYAYLNHEEANGRGITGNRTYSRFLGRRYLATLGFFILALMSKPMAVTLPAVLLILDWFPFGRIRSPKTFWIASLEKAPFIALSAAFSIITIEAQRAGGALLSADEVPISIRIPVAVKSLAAYLGKTLLPIHLMPLYPYPRHVSLLSFEYISSIILVVGITAACAILAKRQKLWMVAWGYYLVTLLPVLGIVQVGGQSMADRYMYLPSLGPFLVAGICVGWLAERTISKRPGAFGRIATGVAASLVLICLSYLTFLQIHIWRDSVTLWSYVIEKGPDKISLAYSQRGIVFGKKGLHDRAMADLETAIALNPYNYDALMNLAVIHEKSGRINRARECVEKAIRARPSSHEAYLYRGALHEETGQLNMAIADYTRAIALDPTYYDAYNNRGVAFGKMGQTDKAIADYGEAIRINPQASDARSNRGVAYTLAGQYGRALEDFNTAILLAPDDPTTYFNRGAFYRRTGRNDLATADFRKACDLGYAKACDALQSPGR
jgi:Flp pilus assembly protein TadD